MITLRRIVGLSLLVGVLFSSSAVLATNYGGGPYGGCTYGSGNCGIATPTPTPIPAVTPTPAPGQPTPGQTAQPVAAPGSSATPSPLPTPTASPTTVQIPVSVGDGDTLPDEPLTIDVGPFGPGTGVDSGEVEGVSTVFRGDTIGSSSEPDATGIYHIPFDPRDYPSGSGVIQVVIKGKNGIIAYRSIPIMIKKHADTPGSGSLDPVVPGPTWVPTEARKLLRKVPEPVARNFPYILLVLLGLGIIYFIWRTRRELAQIRLIMAGVTRLRLIAEEKDNFVQLSAHYMRTPLTIISGGFDLMSSLKGDPAVVAQGKAMLVKLKAVIDGLLGEIASNSRLNGIAAPDAAHVQLRTITSPFLLGPVVMIGLLALFANYLFSSVDGFTVSWIDYVAQMLVYGLLVAVLAGALRSRQTERDNRAKAVALEEYEWALDVARNEFIRDVEHSLNGPVTDLDHLVPPKDKDVAVKNIRAGVERFGTMVHKFDVLASLEERQAPALVTQFGLGKLVTGAVAKLQPEITKKQLMIDNAVNSIIRGNEALAHEVITSVIDNAVKFSPEQGRVSVRTLSTNTSLQLIVEDNGAGIPEAELPHLFKPFSRAEVNSLTFNYEGMGFSLYLDKVIMDHLGGAISATSQPGHGTTVVVDFPLV